ncbi:MAG: putative amidohydrolase YtcJ [Gammaproteobacteria bacterium]|jgi:predicted amidohydrolase YtcJ
MLADNSVISRQIAPLVLLIVTSLCNHSGLAQTADLVYTNAEIYTMDPLQPWANAVAIQDNKFIAVGSNEEIGKFVGKNTFVVDLQGRMAMPGIHDAHTHLEWAGIFMHHECTLPHNATPKKIVETLKDCDVRRPDNWITAGLYSPFIFENGRPDNTFLNEAFPNTPVYLTDFSAHHGLANAKALELAEISLTTSNPVGGVIVRDPDTGAATGELVETANSLMQRVIPAYDDRVYRKALQWAIKMSNQYGITSVQEASATRRELQILNELDNENELSLRVSAHLVWQYERFADATLSEIQKLREHRAQYQSSRVDTRFIKVWLDGAPLPPNFTHSDLGDANQVESNKLLISQEDLNETIASLDRQGLIVKMHVAGMGAARTALNALEYTRKVNGDSGLLHELAHAGFIHEDDMQRMKSLGAVAEMSPAIWHLNLPGFDVLSKAFRFKSLQEKDVHTVVGSDWIIMPTPNIFPALQGMIERGDESIDLASALATVTINGAQVTRQAHLIGSIEKGKDATFIVLDQNLFKIPVNKIHETTVDMTIFEGRTVYETN